MTAQQHHDQGRAAWRLDPWDLIYADASITGLDPARQGYSSLKALLKSQSAVSRVFIDEFSRAGRDVLEWFRLAALAKRLGMNVLGASDGFDLSSPTGEMMLHVLGMFSKFFVTQLREKVHRGMTGAARRQTCLGRPPLGYGLVPKRDAQGRPMTGHDGRTINELAIDSATMSHVMLAAERFADQGWSYGRIAKEFIRLKVDGSDGWRPRSIERLLANPLYIGVAIYNRTRNVRDPETNKRITMLNPRHQWEIQRIPRLRAWSDDQWKRVRRRAYRLRRGKRQATRLSRGQKFPTTLLSGNLWCSCGQELKLVRSGRNGAMGCFHGLYGVNGCTMKTVKARSIVEEAVLAHVRQFLLSEAAVDRLVESANRALAEEAKRPREDLRPKAAEVDRLMKRRSRLVTALAGEEQDDMAEIEPSALNATCLNVSETKWRCSSTAQHGNRDATT